jgi:hypothetical protein
MSQYKRHENHKPHYIYSLWPELDHLLNGLNQGSYSSCSLGDTHTVYTPIKIRHDPC